MFPVKLRRRICNNLTTKDLIHVALAFDDLAECVPLCEGFINFDASDFDEVPDRYIEVMTHFGNNVKLFRLQGNKIDLRPLQIHTCLTNPFPNLVSVILSRTNTFTDLDFLTTLPSTLRVLHLDSLPTMSAIHFVHSLPCLGAHLDKLTLTGIIQLTQFDCVNILQHFGRLTYLDLRKTEYLTAGAAGSILTYCQNLKVFYMTTRLRFRESQAWIDLVDNDFAHVQFNKDVYSQLVTNRYIVQHRMFDSDSDSE